MNISIPGSKKYRHLHSFRLRAVSSPSIINDHPCIISLYQFSPAAQRGNGKPHTFALETSRQGREVCSRKLPLLCVISDLCRRCHKSCCTLVALQLALSVGEGHRSPGVPPDVCVVAEAYLCFASHQLCLHGMRAVDKRTYTDYSNEAENIHTVSGFEANEIRQVTEGICLKEQERPGKRWGSKQSSQNSSIKKKNERKKKMKGW